MKNSKDKETERRLQNQKIINNIKRGWGHIYDHEGSHKGGSSGYKNVIKDQKAVNKLFTSKNKIIKFPTKFESYQQKVDKQWKNLCDQYYEKVYRVQQINSFMDLASLSLLVILSVFVIIILNN